MKKIVLFLIVSVLLAACSQAAAPEQTEAVSQVEKSETESPAAEDSEGQEPDSSTSEDKTGSEESAELETYQSAKMAECRVDNGTQSEAESILSTIVETDWVKGPDDASVTVVEYGDFQ